MAKYAQIEDLKNGEIFRVVEETSGEVYFYDEFRRWCYFNKSEENVNYRYTPAGTRLKTKECKHENLPNEDGWQICPDCDQKFLCRKIEV